MTKITEKNLTTDRLWNLARRVVSEWSTETLMDFALVETFNSYEEQIWIALEDAKQHGYQLEHLDDDNKEH